MSPSGDFILVSTKEVALGSEDEHQDTELSCAWFDKHIRVEGDRGFVAQVLSALSLLQAKAPNEYGMVKEHIGIIKEGQPDGITVEANPPLYTMGVAIAFNSLTWCASSIAHDAYHSKLYQDYKRTHPGEEVPSHVYSGQTVELLCIQYQIEVALAIGAPQEEILYMKSLDGLHAFN